MSRASLFLALAFVGLAAQLAVLVVFLADSGLDFGELGEQAVETNIAVLTLTDLLLTALIVLLWIPSEAARLGIERWWPFAVAALGGVCFALPLFLSARERRLEAPSS
jgi:hypothetical protein